MSFKYKYNKRFSYNTQNNNNINNISSISSIPSTPSYLQSPNSSLIPKMNAKQNKNQFSCEFGKIDSSNDTINVSIFLKSGKHVKINLCDESERSQISSNGNSTNSNSLNIVNSDDNNPMHNTSSSSSFFEIVSSLPSQSGDMQSKDGDNWDNIDKEVANNDQSLSVRNNTESKTTHSNLSVDSDRNHAIINDVTNQSSTTANVTASTSQSKNPPADEQHLEFTKLNHLTGVSTHAIIDEDDESSDDETRKESNTLKYRRHKPKKRRLEELYQIDSCGNSEKMQQKQPKRARKFQSEKSGNGSSTNRNTKEANQSNNINRNNSKVIISKQANLKNNQTKLNSNLNFQNCNGMQTQSNRIGKCIAQTVRGTLCQNTAKYGKYCGCHRRT